MDLIRTEERVDGNAPRAQVLAYQAPLDAVPAPKSVPARLLVGLTTCADSVSGSKQGRYNPE